MSRARPRCLRKPYAMSCRSSPCRENGVICFGGGPVFGRGACLIDLMRPDQGSLDVTYRVHSRVLFYILTLW